MTEKYGQIQGKWGLVRVSGEFELSKFELPGSTVLSLAQIKLTLVTRTIL